MKPGFRHRPPALYRRLRNAENLRCLGNLETGKEAEFNDPCKVRVLFSESLECFVQLDKIDICVGGGKRERGVEMYILLTSATSRGVARLCVVDQDATHECRSDAIELRSTLPLHGFLFGKFEVSLVDECCCLERMTDALALQISVGLTVQLGVDEIQQGFIRFRTSAVTPLPELLGDPSITLLAFGHRGR